jgi:hypothetical protein
MEYWEVIKKQLFTEGYEFLLNRDVIFTAAHMLSLFKGKTIHEHGRIYVVFKSYEDWIEALSKQEGWHYTTDYTSNLIWIEYTHPHVSRKRLAFCYGHLDEAKFPIFFDTKGEIVSPCYTEIADHIGEPKVLEKTRKLQCDQKLDMFYLGFVYPVNTLDDIVAKKYSPLGFYLMNRGTPIELPDTYTYDGYGGRWFDSSKRNMDHVILGERDELSKQKQSGISNGFPLNLYVGERDTIAIWTRVFYIYLTEKGESVPYYNSDIAKIVTILFEGSYASDIKWFPAFMLYDLESGEISGRFLDNKIAKQNQSKFEDMISWTRVSRKDRKSEMKIQMKYFEIKNRLSIFGNKPVHRR